MREPRSRIILERSQKSGGERRGAAESEKAPGLALRLERGEGGRGEIIFCQRLIQVISFYAGFLFPTGSCLREVGQS